MNGVSLIICCHNSANKLPQTIKHVNELTVSCDIPWELIIIDNASTDGTFEAAAQLLSADIKNISKIVTENTLGLRNARLRGIAESQYDCISFIDDDNWICPEWINVVYEIMSEHPDVGACGGVGFPSFESDPPEWFEQYQQCYAVGQQGESTGYVSEARGFLWGAGLSIRRSAWQEIIDNGFIFSLSGRHGTDLSAGEDSEICLALRCYCWRLWYDERLSYYHYLPTFRLDWDYLKKLHKGFGASEVVLSPYREYIHSTELVEPDFHNAWIQDASFIVEHVQGILLQSATEVREDEGSHNVMGVHGTFGHLWAIIKLRHRYDDIKRQIYAFYKQSKLYQEKVKAFELEKSTQELEHSLVDSSLIDEKDEIIHNLHQRIRDIESSLSWRLTAPLRKLLDLLRRG